MAIGSEILGCKWTEAAPNIYRMGWRRFVNELLLISPLLFLACITVQARTRIESFRPVEYTASLDHKIAAYVEPVRAFEQYQNRALGNPDPRSLRRVGEMWREGALNGTLRPLPPEAPGDTTRDGIKGQIRAAADELGARLQRLARKSFTDGNYAQAASDSLLSIEAVQSVKYSDLYAVGTLATRQNSAVSILSRCIEHLSDEQRKEVARRIETLYQTEKPIAELVLAEQRVLSEEVQGANWNQSYRKRLDLMLSLAKQIDNDRSTHELADLPIEMKRRGREQEIDEILPAFRFAWNAQRNGNQDWRNVEAKLTLTGVD